MGKLPDALIILGVLALASLGVWGNGRVRDDVTFLQAADTDISPKAFRALLGEGFFPGGDVYYYRPLTRWLFRLENLLTGGSLAGYHLFNLVLYGMLLVMIHAVLTPWVPGRFARLVGLLFVGLHPATHSIWVYLTGTDILPLMAMAGAVLTSRWEGWSGALPAALLLFVGCFAKETGVLGFPLVFGILAYGHRWKDAFRFALAGVPLALLYLAQRARVVVNPDLDGGAFTVENLLAVVRESLWTPILVLIRPDLCQQENFVRADFQGAVMFGMISAVMWIVWSCTGLWRQPRKVVALAAVFWLFWALTFPNIRHSLELSSEHEKVFTLYVPDHLLFVPLLVMVIPLMMKLGSSVPGRVLGLVALLASAGVGLAKQGEWRDEETLFRAIIKKSPAVSKPYKVLAYRLHESGRHAEAMDVVEQGIRMGFYSSEMFHVAATVAASLKDMRSQGWMHEGAQAAIRECGVEVPQLLKAPHGRVLVLNHLELRRRMFPFEPWFAREQEKYR